MARANRRPGDLDGRATVGSLVEQAGSGEDSWRKARADGVGVAEHRFHRADSTQGPSLDVHHPSDGADLGGRVGEGGGASGLGVVAGGDEGALGAHCDVSVRVKGPGMVSSRPSRIVIAPVAVFVLRFRRPFCPLVSWSWDAGPTSSTSAVLVTTSAPGNRSVAAIEYLPRLRMRVPVL